MTAEKKARGPKVAAPKDTLDIALSLAAVGWPVFPVTIYEAAAGKRAKVPAVKWKAEATTDADTIRTWWTHEHRGCWIGVYAGAAGIVVLDVDPGGDASLAEAGFDVPPTFNYPTHRKGGRHHVYAAPDGVELTIAKGLLDGVDVRSGAGLMVYYGPKLEAPPTLAPAPDWLLVERGESRGGGVDLAPSADVEAFVSRLVPGKPYREHRDAIDAVEFPSGAAHDNMLEVVTTLVRLGKDGAPGIARLMDETRERYTSVGGDRPRDWDNAVTGSVRRLGLPPVTLPLSKAERKAIAKRNRPDAVEKAKAEKKAVYRAKKHRDAIAAASSTSRPMPGDRVLEDASLAEEFAGQLHGRWAYSTGYGLMRYVSVKRAGRWRPAEEHSIIEAVRRLLVEIEVDEHTAAAMRGDNKAIDKARTLLSRSRAAAVARLVIGILAEDEPAFDAHPDFLNTPSGIVDLRTKKLTKHDPLMYFTKMTGAPYDPKADMSMWRKALTALPDDVGAWLQSRYGQAATGYTAPDDVLIIFEGAGENGKTSFLIGARRALGDYAVTLPERLLVADPGDHPTTLMTLMGTHVGVIEELPEGRALNVKRLKDTVGTPEITARKMRQDDITFTATHCLFLSTNYLPIVAETDHGTWRRLVLVRFGVRFVKRKADVKSERDRVGDPKIKAHFEHTADPGLLRWIVDGAAAWYANDKRMPRPPKKVRSDTDKWRMDADPILAYASERIVRDEGFAITATDLADDFNRWLDSRGHKTWSGQTINSRLQGHVSFDGIERKSVKWSLTVRPSRPSGVFHAKPIPKVTTSWRGIRFVDEDHIPSEAELDAAALADLERRARA